jgi:DnaK suppressor protein
MTLNSDQIAKWKEILLEKRAMLVSQVERLTKDAAESTQATENSKSPINSADNAADAFEQDFAFMSIESEEVLLRKIDLALRKIRENNYGCCENCEKTINNERLEALPWATTCVKCQELEERGLLNKQRDDAEFEIPDDGEEALIEDKV